VHDLAIKEGDLVAATHGRSFWILDDISPLRQLSAASVAAEAHLFAPRDAYRVDWGGSGGSDAHPAGKNPPSGVMIYYSVKNAHQEVGLDILDSAGRVIRSFSSRQDSLTAVDSLHADSLKRARTDSLKRAGVADSVKIDSILGTLPGGDQKEEDKPWPHRPPADPRVSNKAGLNLFVWDMHWPDARAFWGMSDIATGGPLALPGRYRVRLHVGSTTETAAFRLRQDPRSKVTLAELREQFAFLKQVRDTVNAVTTAIIRLRNVRSQLEDRLHALPATAGGEGGAHAAAQGLIDKLDALEDTLYQVRLQADEDGLVYPSRPVERLSTLAWVAGGTDARPTAAARAIFALFAPDLQRGLTALQGVLSRDLPAVNAALRAAGQTAATAGDAELRPPKARG
jgi:hypothetical protein